MPEKYKYRRKKLLVDKKFQIRFILRIYLFVAIILLILAALLYLVIFRGLSRSVYSKIVELRSTGQILLPLILIITIVVLVLSFFLIGIRFLFVSHKIAGPMYRFIKTIKQVKNGDLTVRIRFRKKDELQPVAKVFTDMTRTMDNKLKNIKRLALQINSANPSILTKKLVDAISSFKLTDNR